MIYEHALYNKKLLFHAENLQTFGHYLQKRTGKYITKFRTSIIKKILLHTDIILTSLLNQLLSLTNTQLCSAGESYRNIYTISRGTNILDRGTTRYFICIRRTHYVLYETL
jgi:hypothetical protein